MGLFQLLRLTEREEVITPERKPTRSFQLWWQKIAELLEGQINLQAEMIEAIAAAQNAANAANMAAENAQTAVNSLTAVSALSASYVTGCNINGNAFDERVEISSHTRVYGDGTTTAVDAGMVLSGAVTYGGTFYLFYDDAPRTGGSVTYDASTNFSDAVASSANPDRHYVGSIVMPGSVAGPDTVGQPALPPGVIPPA